MRSHTLIPDNRRRFTTANEFVLLDDVDRTSGAVRSLSFLYEAARGTLVMEGAPEGFVTPALTVDGEPVSLADARWTLEDCWIPRLEMETPAGVFRCTYLCPPARRGFCARIEFQAVKAAEVELAFHVRWSATRHVSDLVRDMHVVRCVGYIPGTEDSVYLALRAAWPICGVGLAVEPDALWEMSAGGQPLGASQPEIAAETADIITGGFRRKQAAAPGDLLNLTLYTGVGIEASSGVACAQDLQQEGWDSLLVSAQRKLEKRMVQCTGQAEPFQRRLNENIIYGYTLSQGVTVDTERMVVTSSRSPRYDHTGSYRDRDNCLFSLPAALLVDPPQARRMLEYAFGVQMRNVGARSRCLDGVPLQPGFCLDAVVAPLRALWMYVDLTGDLTILFDQDVQNGINQILHTLEGHCDQSSGLCATRLGPGERPVACRYVTYSNVLVWRALADLSDLYGRIRDVDRANDTQRWARELQPAILKHCVVEGPLGPMFCRATNATGGFELGDDPEGSLLLLAHLEFCKPDFEPFRNTARYIRQANAANGQDRSCLLVMANELLAGNTEPLARISSAPLDDGIACGMLGDDGSALQGKGWAACAAYLGYALVRAMEDDVRIPALRDANGNGKVRRSSVKPGVGWV